MTAGQRSPRLTQRLGFRLALTLAVVLLPLSLISMAKSLALDEQSRARSELALMGETMRAVGGELRMIQRARGAAQALSQVILSVASDPEACSADLRRFIAPEGNISFVAYVQADGISSCNSEARRVDLSENSQFLTDSRNRAASIVIRERGVVSQTSVLVFTAPVFDGDSVWRGLVSISVPHSELAGIDDGGDESGLRPLTVITFDARGNLLTASGGLDGVAAILPRDRSLTDLASQASGTFPGSTASGEARLFSVVPLVPAELFALGTWNRSSGGVLASSLPPALLPATIWLASLVVTWLAVERLVIRHIRRLKRSMDLFTGGNRKLVDPDLAAAPLELREMADAYVRLTEAVLHDEAQLEDMVRQKEVLLREIHHRVKNNLQLIASIMNMQIRRAATRDAREVLRRLQDRIMSLAAIHRELYQSRRLSDIRVPVLLETIIQQILGGTEGAGRRYRYRAEIDDVSVSVDQAVPLALLLSEAMGNVMTHGDRDGATETDFRVAFRRVDDEMAELAVTNNVRAAAIVDGRDPQAAGLRTGLGSLLMRAIASQLNGTISVSTTATSYEVRVLFRLEPAAAAAATDAGDAAPLPA